MTGAEQTPQERHAANCSWKVMPAPGEELCDGGCMTAPQERLIEVVRDEIAELYEVMASTQETPGYEDEARVAVAAILDSDVIREMRQQDRREAWSEGHQDGWSDRSHIAEDQTRNPYRQEASDGE